jgi:hypothetical protein
VLDELRENPRETILRILSPPEQRLDPAELPLMVRGLSWMFLSSQNRKWFSSVALRVLGLK